MENIRKKIVYGFGFLSLLLIIGDLTFHNTPLGDTLRKFGLPLAILFFALSLSLYFYEKLKKNSNHS